MFGGAHVLILEDEPITALDLAITVEAADGVVVGPAGTVAEALALVDAQEVAAAILDANLPDGTLTPVAVLLRERGIPIIVHTGLGLPDDLQRCCPDVPVRLKPTSADDLVEAVSSEMRK